MYLFCIFLLALHILQSLPRNSQSTPTLIWEEHLVDHYVMNIDVILSQLDHQSLRFKQGQELRDTHRYECCFLRILELSVHFFDVFLEAL